MRDLVADVRLHPDDLVMPLFVRVGSNINKPVSSMPGVAQMSPDVALATIRSMAAAGLRAFILFGVTEPERKDAAGSAALDPANPVNTTLRMVRDAGVEALLIADLCFCEYTDHGHCGVLSGPLAPGERAGVRAAANKDCDVDNDATLLNLAAAAAEQARAGADVVAPSGMMDGQVRAIRRGLDSAGFDHAAILSYSVKYASSMYGPFREAGEGAPQFGDRRGYQMDYRRSREWKRELELDLAEGADAVMVKPAATYLDVISAVRGACDVPVAAYHVSGEYSMIHAAAERNWIDLKGAAVETTTAIKRAGADLILTYFAPKLIEWL
jgi:porphobilinogen synthase